MSAPSFLHAIDPGLDELVIAVFDLARYRALTGGRAPLAVHRGAMQTCVHVERVKTNPGERPAARAALLAPVLKALHATHPAVHSILEAPTSLVPYGGHTGLAVAQLALSLGVVVGVLEAGGHPWSALPPDRAPRSYEGGVKRFRRDRLHALCRAVGAKCERSQDVIDAQWMGLRGLNEPPILTWLAGGAQ
jgi:hypothetical protein